MAAANDGIAILDEQTEFVYANSAYAETFGYEDTADILHRHWRTLLTDESVERMESTVIPAVDADGSWKGELRGVRRDGTEIDLSVAITRLEDGGFVNVCSDISAQKRQQRRLRALNELSQTLMQAECWDEITRLGIEAVVDCVPYDIVAIRRFDTDENKLRLDSMTEPAESLVDANPAYDLESTYAGSAYRRGDPVKNEIQTAHPREDHLQYSSLHVPMQEYGTISVLAPKGTKFDTDILEFVQLVGTALGVAYEHVEREQALRRGRNELTRFSRVNAVIREIIHSLVEATTREEIETTICEQLSDSELYEYAWIGRVNTETEEIVPRANAGIEADILRVSAGIDLFEAGSDTVLRAVETGEIETVRQYHVDEQSAQSNGQTADEPEAVDVVAAIPLSYGRRVYGVLILSTTKSETFDESIRAEFKLLGDVAGFAISAVQNQQLLLSNRITELKFEVRDRNNLLVAISDDLDCRCRFEIAEPTDAGNIKCYIRAREVSVDDPAEVIKQIESVEEAALVSRSEGEYVFEIVRTEPLARELARTGANVRLATGEHGTAEIVLELPQSADISDIVDEYQSLYPDSELVAKRQRTRGNDSVGTFQETVGEILTERQRTALETAYEAGYFEWPREQTAEELAEMLDISSSTFHQHLRTAEQKLFSKLLDS